MKNPIISVLLPIGKDRKFLKESLDSIRKQSFQSFELLLGENEKGSITTTLNDLAKKAKGEFLARMDADDVSEPDRFQKQVEFLKKHPSVQLVGTSATLIDEQGKKIGIQDMPTTWKEIQQKVFFKNPLIHPSWMMRRAWFERIGGYNKIYRYAQDWELILRRVWRDEINNLPDQLLRLRIHKKSLSFQENSLQVSYGLRARLEAIRRHDVPFWYGFGLTPSLFSLLVPTKMKFILRSR